MIVVPNWMVDRLLEQYADRGAVGVLYVPADPPVPDDTGGATLVLEWERLLIESTDDDRR